MEMPTCLALYLVRPKHACERETSMRENPTAGTFRQRPVPFRACMYPLTRSHSRDPRVHKVSSGRSLPSAQPLSLLSPTIHPLACNEDILHAFTSGHGVSQLESPESRSQALA